MNIEPNFSKTEDCNNTSKKADNLVVEDGICISDNYIQKDRADGTTNSIGDDEIIDLAASRILHKYRRAFEELAK